MVKGFTVKLKSLEHLPREISSYHDSHFALDFIPFTDNVVSVPCSRRLGILKTEFPFTNQAPLMRGVCGAHPFHTHKDSVITFGNAPRKKTWNPIPCKPLTLHCSLQEGRRLVAY